MSSKEVTKDFYGKTKDGKDVFSFTLTNGTVTVRALNFGCAVKDILVPDKNGTVVDINLGYGNFSDYEKNPGYLGCLCGRVANRIDGASFTLDGVKYEVSKNDPLGNNLCHGGFIGYSRRYWDWQIQGTKLILTYVDKDGTEGFPGDVTTTVTYEVNADNELVMDYTASTTKPTPVDMASHFMVNLAGHAAGSVRDHVARLCADKRLVFNDRFIPTGEIEDVSSSVFDLRKAKHVDDVLDKFPAGDGMHTAYVVGDQGNRKLVARVDHPTSKRYMEVYSTEPAVVAYSCYYLDFLLKDMKCKDNVVYQKEGGILFMPQNYPDAVNHKHFPNTILRPGETYHSTTWYRFGVSQ